MAHTVHRRSKRPRTLREKLLIGAGILGLVILVLLAWVLVNVVRVTATPPLPPEAREGQSVGGSAGYQVPPLNAQLQQAARAFAAAPNQPVTLYVGGDALVRELTPSLARSGVEDLKVYCGDGTVAAQGLVPAGGRKVHTTVRLRPQVREGRLQLELLDARVGTRPMPASLRRQLEQELAKAENDPSSPLARVYLDAVQVTPGLISITGRARTQ